MKDHPASHKKKSGTSFFRIIFFIVLTLLLSIFPYQNKYFQKIPVTGGVFNRVVVPRLPSPVPYPVNTLNIPPPPLTAAGVYIKDVDSGAILYGKNEGVRYPPASTTKIMTVLVALDFFKLDDILTVKTVIKEGRTMGLTQGEKMVFEYLLDGALIHSANDAAYTIAENYPGGVSSFVDAMNRKARDLKLADTHFANPIGFDDPDNYTTAKSLAIQAEIALDNFTLSKTVGIRNMTVVDTTYSHFHALSNVNELLGKVAGVSGIKTGFTENGGEILVSEIKKNDRSILLVLLHSSDRFGETEKLIQWVFDSFTWKDITQLTPAIRQQQQERMQ